MILIVDDDPTSRRILEVTVKHASYVAITASTAPEALAMLDREQGIDLIITDHRMPGMAGLEFVHQVRARPSTRHIPVIMCTSAADRSTFSQAIENGVRDFIVKPIVPSVVVSKVREMLNRTTPVVSSKSEVMNRLRLSEPEYRDLASTALDHFAGLTDELEMAREDGDEAEMIRIASLLVEPCQNFGAERCVTLARQIQGVVEPSARRTAATLLVDALVEAREVLRRTAAPSLV